MNLNQITIPVLDVEKAIAFYNLLGLELIVHSSDHYARFFCPDGKATFSLQKVTELPKGNGPKIYFECDNVDEEVERLQGLGIVFDELPTDQAWLWREAHFTDVDGNSLVIYKAGENRINPPWKLK